MNLENILLTENIVNYIVSCDPDVVRDYYFKVNPSYDGVLHFVYLYKVEDEAYFFHINFLRDSRPVVEGVAFYTNDSAQLQAVLEKARSQLEKDTIANEGVPPYKLCSIDRGRYFFENINKFTKEDAINAGIEVIFGCVKGVIFFGGIIFFLGVLYHYDLVEFEFLRRR